MDEHNYNQELDAFLARTIFYPKFKVAYDTLTHIYKFGGRDAELVVLIGPVGAGKSHMIEQLMLDYPIRDTDEQTFRPILYARIPPENTYAGLLGNLLEAMGDPLPWRGLVVERRMRLKHLITQQQTRMITLDESQSVIPRSGADAKTANVKLLLELMNDLKIPILLAGKEDLLALMAADDAIRSRTRCKLSLSYFSCMTRAGTFDFADYIQGLIGFFPRKVKGFNFFSVLDDGKPVLKKDISTLIRLILATDGCPRSIRFLFKAVIERTTSDTVVELKHFADAFYTASNLEIPLSFNPLLDSESIAKVSEEAERRGLYDSDAF
ncbi:AAA family ATPase [Agarivorans sp. B2Z047]|uniref:TniB family NTP-binding protein n=1 Tax=Agarivorans sp. B2Z047 TaxID=2652721 RepID=UPI00128B2AB8|nr:TniB family NTP-binding protein [Agarivorans sp. B2Z047]MPW27793.1 AAA family ATPase [Agarivorans sp. B2Z047]UQN44372.1 TniB family NTP-binding protein [Agarivorans sp. B2Z047]